MHTNSDQTEDFKSVISIYVESQYAIKGLSPDFDINAKHEWTEVIDLAREAQKRYEAAEKGIAGSGRRLFRFLGTHAAAIQPWIDLLPKESYGWLICAALKVGLGVC